MHPQRGVMVDQDNNIRSEIAFAATYLADGTNRALKAITRPHDALAHVEAAIADIEAGLKTMRAAYKLVKKAASNRDSVFFERD